MDKKRDDISIVIPSYNEDKNIFELIRGIRSFYPEFFITVVDDSDQTLSKQLKQSLEKKFSHVFVLSRSKKLGRGSAVLDGMRYVLKHTSCTHIIEMDADLSHDPSQLYRLLDASKRYECVIGSRYLPQSSIPEWPLRRRILSKIINRILRTILGIPVSDFTNGYRCYSRNAARSLLSADLKETGFIALSEWLYVLHNAGISIGEVPITFTDRKYGRSNAGLEEHLNAIRGVIRLRLRSL